MNITEGIYYLAVFLLIISGVIAMITFFTVFVFVLFRSIYRMDLMISGMVVMGFCIAGMKLFGSSPIISIVCSIVVILSGYKYYRSFQESTKK